VPMPWLPGTAPAGTVPVRHRAGENRVRAGSRRRDRWHAVRAGPGGDGNHRGRDHVQAGQDFSHQRLRHVHSVAEAGGRGLSPELGDPARYRSGSGNRRTGNFKARLHHMARYVKPEKCTSCGEYARVCPVWSALMPLMRA